MIDRRLAAAPMMDVTDRHWRHLARLLSRRTLLYTEMITTGALVHGPRARLLAHDCSERPVALQLGGADPAAMAECARWGEAAGYDEIDINVGCPSDRVQSGRFGACLMAEPEIVAACVRAMRRAVAVPVTVKHRIGIDGRDGEAELHDFVARLADAGCQAFVVHARIAILAGLSPRENREVPPLRYEVVHRLKARFPGLAFVLNGGLKDFAQARAAAAGLDGVMIGRAFQDAPYRLAYADAEMFGEAASPPDRSAAVRAYLAYVEREVAAGTRLWPMLRPLIPLFHGMPGGRLWRRHLSEAMQRERAGPGVILEALDLVAGAEARLAA